MTRASEGRARKAVKLPSYDVAERVARQGVSRQQDYVEQQDERADSYSNSPVKKESAKRVAPEKDEEDKPHIQKVAMKVLQDKRKPSLALVVALPALAASPGRRIEEEGPVISLPVVVARNPEPQRQIRISRAGESGNQRSWGSIRGE